MQFIGFIFYMSLAYKITDRNKKEHSLFGTGIENIKGYLFTRY